MFHVVLVEPQIPPNTGNIIRLCANTGARLHLVEPLGFPLDDAKLRRAGLDYHEFAELAVYAGWTDFVERVQADALRRFAFTTRATTPFASVAFAPGDWFVFGSETAGLNDAVRADFDEAHSLRLPMRAGMRSLNLSNAVAVVVFEAWRQCGYQGAV